MTRESLRILLIEDNPGDARLLHVSLSEVLGSHLTLDVEESLSAGMSRLLKESFSIVLLDLGLPDSQGLDTLEAVLGSEGHTPVVVLTGHDDEEAGIRAVKMGAQDYVVKGQASGELLSRLIRHAIERKEGSEKQKFSWQILEELNRQSGGGESLASILDMIKEFTRFEAAGLRLRDGEDYPYYTTDGFSDGFVEQERSLCTRDQSGRVVTDARGNPHLECMCGNVIRGRTDATLPFFTKAGSFWTNSTTTLLATTTEEDRQARTRNRCNGEGYESVALIPLRSSNESIGLLQLNDRREGMFTLEMIEFLEEVGSSIGIALARKMAEATLASATKALKVSEENFRRLFNDSTDGILLADPETKRFHLANDTFCRMTGHTPAQVTELGIQDLHPEEDLSRIIDIFEMQARQEITLASDLPVKRKDGSVFYADINSAPIVQQGKTYIMGTFRDVTERRSLESQLRQSQKMEAVGLLAGGIAHDFNNLLSVIIGYSDLSGMDVREHDPVFEYVGEIRKAADKAANLTSQLLAFSRKTVLDPTIVDLNETVSGIQEMLGRVLGEDIDIVLALAPDIVKTRIDESQLEQILMNLVVNARDAMPSGGSLTIETANTQLDAVHDAGHLELEPGSYVMLRVADTGQGMDEKTIVSAFEPFFTTKPRGRGTGLGLSTVFGIVKQSGGDIHLHSEVGKGTTFRIYLPAADEAEERPRPHPAGPVAISGIETILVVEDEAALLKLLARILSRKGYNVLKAASAGEALLACKEHDGQIHLLLTDVVMPRMSGNDLAGWMDSLSPETKVIYMSGYTDDAIASHGVLDEGVHFIGKPFTAEQVLSKIRAVLDEEA